MVCFIKYPTFNVCKLNSTPITNLVEIRFPKTFSALYHQPNLVTSPIKGNLEFLTPRCIPIHILSWTDCVRSGTGMISYVDIFSSSNLQK